jgi:hypothetical protein
MNPDLLPMGVNPVAFTVTDPDIGFADLGDINIVIGRPGSYGFTF